MKLGIIVYSNNPEVVWNAFRLGNFALKKGDGVRAFLIAGGVECESLDTESFKVTEQMQAFIEGGGNIFACGTCLKMRHSKGTEHCPFSTMNDLYEMITDCDRVVSF
ncbi:MAG: DsrE family protein [bacterium]